jgi:hypothetical protein
MNTKSITFAAGMGLLTALTLAGSIFVIFAFFGPHGLIKPGLAFEAAGGILYFVIPLLGGGLWGSGIALMTKADAKALLKTGALTWAGAALLSYAILGMIGTFDMYLPDFPSAQFEYLVLFSPAAGITAAFPARALVGKLGLGELRKRTGISTGIAATLGFLVVGLVLQYGFGWEVGRPMPGRYSMVTILQWCCLGAALAGGMAFGWVLDRSRIDKHRTESVNP